MIMLENYYETPASTHTIVVTTYFYVIIRVHIVSVLYDYIVH